MAPDGWHEVDLDVPLWRFALLAALFAGGYLGVALVISRQAQARLDLRDWIAAGAITAAFLAPPLMRRLYLRRKRA